MTHVQYALVVLLVGTSWTIEPIAATGLIAAALAYGAGVERLRQKGRLWPRRRTIPFISGLIAIFLATQSPLGAQDTRLFSAHVVQHLLLAMVAPVLLCSGAPITLALQAFRRPAQKRLLWVLHSRSGRVLAWPIFTWALFAGSLFVLYFTSLYELTLRNEFFHQALHVHFIAAGFLFFAPIIAIDPHPYRLPHAARLGYMGLTLPVHAFLALALLSAIRPLAGDWYAAETGRSIAQILSDQKIGASIMWVSGDLISITIVAIVVLQWVRDDERDAVREDRYIDAQRQAEQQIGETEEPEFVSS